MDVCFVIQQRLKELGLEQRDLAAAAQVTESYISQLLTRKKSPPAADRTDLYEKMNAFLKLPKGQLSAMVRAQRHEELKKKLAEPPAPLFKEVRELVIRKCVKEKQAQIRDIFGQQAFGELERLVTQKLLDVTQGIARDELNNESWLPNMAKQGRQSYEELRALILEFLDTDVLDLSAENCASFLEPILDWWDIELKSFAMEIVVNKGLAPPRMVQFEFVEMRNSFSSKEEPGFKEFLRNATLSGDATQEELEFLENLRFRNQRPSALYYYRELQNLRDPLHFPERNSGAMHKRREGSDDAKQAQIQSRKKAIRRWARNNNPSNGGRMKPN
jgi:transcriptional regulator with XRE-family HTH domain